MDEHIEGDFDLQEISILHSAQIMTIAALFGTEVKLSDFFLTNEDFDAWHTFYFCRQHM